MHGLCTVYARLFESVQNSAPFEARNGRKSLNSPKNLEGLSKVLVLGQPSSRRRRGQ